MSDFLSSTQWLTDRTFVQPLDRFSPWATGADYLPKIIGKRPHESSMFRMTCWSAPLGMKNGSWSVLVNF
jgi:hypothetical protein